MGKSLKSGEKVGKSGEKTLSIAVFTISDQYATFFLNFFSKWPPGPFGFQFFQKSIGTYLHSRSVATSNMKLIGVFLIKLWSAQAFSSYFHKMAVGGHFGFPIFSKIDRHALKCMCSERFFRRGVVRKFGGSTHFLLTKLG